MSEHERLLMHPAMPELIARYRSARSAWRYTSPAGMEAAQRLGWTERSYADRYIAQLPPIYYAADVSSPHLDRRHHDLAFEAAG